MTEENNIPTLHRGEEEPQHDRWFKLRNTLNIIFMLLTVAGVCIYYFSSSTTGSYVLLIAIVIKIVECCFRFSRR